VASQPTRRPPPVTPRRRRRPGVGCLMILGVMALGAAAGVVFTRTQLHDSSSLGSVVGAVYGAGGACLGGTVLLFLVALPRLPGLLAQYPELVASLPTAVVMAVVAAILTLPVLHLPSDLVAVITSTSFLAAGIATYLSIQAPPGKRLRTFLSTFFKAMGSGGNDPTTRR
jgi:hypothetical protein